MKFIIQILSFFLKRTILAFVIVFFQFSFVFGQDKGKLDFYFETDTISVDQGRTFTNFLVLKNLGLEEMTIESLATIEDYPGTLLLPNENHRLQPNEKKRLPIKFIANTDFMRRESAEIKFQLSYNTESGKLNQTALFWIHKEIEKQIALYSFSRENYINPSMTETSVSIFVENRSYSRRSIKLRFKSQPDDLEISPKEQTIALEAREKKMVELKVAIRRNSDFYPDYNIQVEAIDLIDNEKVGNTNIRVIALSNNRQVMRGAAPQHGKNFAEIAYNENSSGHNYIQFRGNTEFSTGKELQGRFNIAGDYFMKEDQYNLYDTWFELERKGTLLRLGNLYGNDYDYSISGRGAKVNTTIGNNKAIEVFALESNYSLYGTYFPESNGSKIVGAKYEYGSLNTFNGKVSYLFDHNPRLETESHLAHWKTSFKLDSIHNLQIEAGLSHEKGLINQEENSGVSSGVNYRAQLGNWDFQSTNSLASKTYVGLNRGSFNLNQNIGYQLAPRQQVFIQYQNAQIAPEYLTFQTSLQGSELPSYRPDYFHSTQSAQIGYQFAVANWNVLVAPEVEKQKNIANLNSNELLSYRFRTNMGTSFGSHGVNLSLEYSHSKANYQPDWFQSFKSNFSYRFKDFSLNGSVQINPSNVIDLNQYNYTTKDFFNYNIYASYNFQTANRLLTGSLSAGTNYSGLYKNENQNISGNLEYKFASSWAATAYGNYSNFKSTQAYGYAGNNYQLKVGIKKYFIKATSAGNHKVSLQLFEDTNANGKLDAGEKVLVNEAVKLDDFVAITDRKGKVTFQNVPKGSYTLKINESAELRLMMDPIIGVYKNIKLEVGLIKNNRVTGKLVEIKQAYDVLDTDVRGVIVYARNQDGKVLNTVVNQNNEFEFFLKNGVYDIYIENDKYRYREPSKRILVSKSDISEVLIFEYSKKDTTIKVKKF